MTSERLELPDLQSAESAGLGGPVCFRAWDGPGELTFVLVHGLGGSHLTWVQVAPALSGLGRVVALDLPGFGATPRAGRSTGIMDLRRTLSAFLAEATAGPVVIAGNSLGGGLGILQAAIEPATVSGLVLTSSIFPWPGPPASFMASIPHPVIGLAFLLYDTPRLGEWFVAERLRRLDGEHLVRMGLRYVAAHPERLPAEVVEAMIELADARMADPEIVPAFVDAARSMLRLGRRPEVARRALDAVTCPVLVIHGRRDHLVPPAFAEAELARHPAWRARFFPDVGHAPQMEAPGRWLGEVADWMSQTRR
jgi:pimeloyl-ACP methyl ester carboxylesterase